MPAEALAQLLEPVWAGTQALSGVHIPSVTPDIPTKVIATGFSYVVAQTGTVDGGVVTWQEQRQVVRSEAHAQGQQKVLEDKVAKAVVALEGLNERKQGKKRLDAAELLTASVQIVQRCGVANLVAVEVVTTTAEVEQRKYKDRAAGVVAVTQHTVKVTVQTAAIAARKQLCGWRVYVTNAVLLTVAAAVQAYRGQYRIEHDFARLKGKPLKLTPMYLQREDRVAGLVHLLSIGLRLLTLIEFVVRSALQESGEKLRGVHTSQAGRGTMRPSAELLLRAFRGVDMWIVEHEGVRYRKVSALTAAQKRILQLLKLPPSIYHRLAGEYPKSG